MKEVFPGIYLIKEKGSFGAIKPPENIYVLAGYDGLIYDAGYGNNKSISYLINQIKELEQFYKQSNMKFKLTRVLPSHCHPDHFSGLKMIRKKLGVKILLTERMAALIKNKYSFKKTYHSDDYEDYFIIKKDIRQKITDFLEKIFSLFFYRRIYGLTFINDPDEIIKENTNLLINGETWNIFHTPGHAVDHISLYNEEKGILFSGDNILRTITTWLGPPNCSIEDYVNSIEMIQKLPNLRLILAAHGSPIENPKKRIEEILEHRKARTQQVLNIVNENSESGITPNQLIKYLYPKVNRMRQEVARGWICLTLKLLEEKNQIKRKEEKRKIKFFPVDKL